MNYHFYPAIIYKSGYYGVAILSRYPLLRPARHELPNETGLEQRVLGTAIVDLPGIDSVMIACTHLQNSSANNRIDQVKKIVDLLAPVSTPLIIGGDFNEKPTAERFFSIFDANFTRTCPGTDCPFTFSTGNPNAVIDYLAYKPTGSFTVTQHEVIEEKNASDHFPVIATFKFNR
jgi:endonuclease/exonuclease/phosphatase family metal-dependent hydrolase